MSFKYRPSNDFLISILVILFIVLLCFVLDLYLYERHNSDQIRKEGKIITQELNLNVEMFLKDVEAVADGFTDRISSGEITEDNIIDQLNKTLKFEHEISSIGVLFTPYSYDENLRLYSPYTIKEDNETKTVRFDSSYDYSTGSVPWYGESINLEENWTDPFHDEITQKEYVYFTKTFKMRSKDGRDISGLLFIGVSTKDLRDKLSSLTLNHLGQSYIVTKEGLYIIEPMLIGTGETDSPNVSEKDKSGFIKFKDRNTGETVYQFYSLLKSNDWVIVFNVFENEAVVNYSPYRKKVINIIISLTIFLTALAFYFIKTITFNYRPAYLFWFFSIPLFLLYILGSVFICRLGLDYQDKTEKEQNAILNASLLEDFKLQYIKDSLSHNEEPPVFIPTGILIESIDFKSSSNVNIKGIIWQKYSKGIHDGIERNISIPNANDESLAKFFEKEVDDYTLVEWDFNINMSSDFHYKKYPFNNENLWLQFKNPEFDKNIVLVPDLDSYRLGSARYLPGLDKNIKIMNWKIQSSFFSYTYTSYNTNFGIEDFSGQLSFPEIYFNIILRPNILNVFISHFLPIAIALFLIYAIFKTATSHYVVRPYATLFLALIFLQISLRSNLGASEIVYIEYYYFLTYFIMAGVSLNAILLQNSKWGLVHYRNNIIPKLFFWPFTGLAILVLNTVVFYN